MKVDAAFFQSLGALLSGLAALITALLFLFNRARISVWFKRRDALIAERNVAISRLTEMTDHAKDARTSVRDIKETVTALRLNLESTNDRIVQLERRQPLYDACVLWIPRAIDYIVWIETLATQHGLDLGGREMPALPEVIRDAFPGLIEGRI